MNPVNGLSHVQFKRPGLPSYSKPGSPFLVKPPVTALCHPVLSAVADSGRTADWAARPTEAFQGVCFALVWPMDLWGEERRRLSVELEARSLGRW